jgi:D-3-phosphoglycerate dehydrogenase
MTWRVLVTAPRACQSIERYERELGTAGCLVDHCLTAERLDEQELLPIVKDVDALICGDDRITERVLDAAPRLKVIAKWGTGIDSIDVEAARRRGIPVRNTPDAFTDAVADTVLASILLFARKLDRLTADMRAGRWERIPLRALSECTLGIVGMGHIGTAVARRAYAFRMPILTCDVRPAAAGVMEALGVQVVDLDVLLSRSDFVTLHTDLRPGNRHLIDARRLSLMRPTAVLINTARGPLVDEAALAAAISTGRLGGAALDVFEEEPLPAASELRTLANVYLSPHNANASAAAAERVHGQTIRNVLTALETTIP